MIFRRRHRGNKTDRKDGKSGSEGIADLQKIVLIGNPNVGKSLIFGRLTGSYVAVSNYPGTTVAIDTGKCKLNGKEYGIIDSPGMYSFIPITEEERVAKQLLLEERPRLVIHVIDARNMERMLPMTLQMIETDLPIMLVVNMMDEAEAAGIKIDCEELETTLGIPTVPVVATTCRGFPELIFRMGDYVAS